MPDIAMCTGEDCPLKRACYRFTARPNKLRQSYFSKPPLKNGKCKHFWLDNSKLCERIKSELLAYGLSESEAIEKLKSFSFDF